MLNMEERARWPLTNPNNIRRHAIRAEIHRTHLLLDFERATDIRRLLFSRKQIASVVGCNKDTAAKAVEELVTEGLLARERYMLTTNPRDRRWQWLYHITDRAHA
jgi:hypothetical protein